MKSTFDLRKHAGSGAASEDASLETAAERVENQHIEVSLIFVEAKAVRVDLLSQDLLQHGQCKRDRRAQERAPTRYAATRETPRAIN